MSPAKIELEAQLEARCVAKIEAAGGLALKLVIPGVRGFPDRTCLLPMSMSTQTDRADGVRTRPPRAVFFEFKRIKTGRISAQQHRWRVLLHQLGFNVYFIDDDHSFDVALARETAS